MFTYMVQTGAARRTVRWTPAVSLLGLLVLAGCAGNSGGVPAADREIRPAYQPGPDAGGVLEGQIRNHTRGTLGDALGCDLSLDGTYLAFSWNEHQQEPKLYVVPTAGGNPRQITFGTWPDIHPKFVPSPEPGQYRVAYASKREGNFDIYVVTLSGSGGAWQLTSDSADEHHPTFSPDGRYVAFARLDHDRVWRIYKKDLQTQLETVLGPGSNPEWSPTGDQILFQLPSGRGQQLWSVWRMRADGSVRTQVDAGENYGAVHPSWSPEGRYFAVTRLPARSGGTATPTGGDIWVKDTQTGASFKLTMTASVDTDPCWSVDGWIFFSSTRTTGRFNILSGKLATDVLAPIIAEEELLPPHGGNR